MTQPIFVGDIVEENGLSIKENNLTLQHTIPIGTLVEITYDSQYDEPDEKTCGLRLFVVNHSRDCDGTPLYDLSFDKKSYKEWEQLDKKVKQRDFENSMDEALTKAIWWQTGGKILRHYSADSLKIVSL